MRKYRVILAGVGSDAHSVGLNVLRHSLGRAGYDVLFLGVQQEVHHVCEQARHVDAILISNMDGHAGYYLRDLRVAQHDTGTTGRLWYLGGYPSLADDSTVGDGLLDLGFDRVFRQYIGVTEVLGTLAQDLSSRRLVSRDPMRRPVYSTRTTPSEPDPIWAVDQLRDDVLAHWWSGESARNRAENAHRMRSCVTLAHRQREAADNGTLLIQPRTGVSDHRGQARLFRGMRDGGADVLSFQIDSLTRNNRYSDIELILKNAPDLPSLSSVLNGYPAVNLGLEAIADLASEFNDVPMQVRHSTRDPRLLAELTFGAGVSAFEGGPISYNLPYFRDYPIAEAIDRWRYVDLLAGSYFQEHGVVIDREFFGVLTACLVPPCLAAAANVFEALLAAESGVKSVTLGYAEQGHRTQDLAAVRASARLARHYLAEAGHDDVRVHVVWHQFMGPFPSSESKARQILIGSAVSAAHSDAVRLMLKTSAEGRHIPSLEENRDSLALVRGATSGTRAAVTELHDSDRTEEELIVAETSAILDCALAAGRGSVGQALQIAVSTGWLDIPFSPSRWNAGKVLPLRDCTGAVRLAATGRLPLTSEVQQFHRDAIAARFARDGDNLGELIQQDMQLTAEGRFDDWPIG
ncbi:methylaspartate mutase subunit E [Nocardia speluncae]|uniref:Methylaspartate mutase subunit E n=1 Tax=Nocardia speluncae TaxID=419477 RepID=A0A846XD49_9NOCA|nr:cobalamin-dependent protein [Nocardia speluncae]NKY33862.1 methylaspartate mutase subunit E [Nocardia speluncae]